VQIEDTGVEAPASGPGCTPGASPFQVLCDGAFLAVELDLGDRDDTAEVTGGPGGLPGGESADARPRGAGAAWLLGGGGDDRLRGSDLRDTLRGEDGADHAAGEGAGDRLEGGAGDDVLDGGSGDDGLTGGLGADVLDGGGGSDVLSGSGGDDLVTARDGVADRVACGSGSDRVVADREDEVSATCERVERPAPPPPPAPAPPPPPAPASPLAPVKAPLPPVAPARPVRVPARPDTVPPAVAVALTAAGVSADGTVHLSAACPPAELEGCSGWVTLWIPRAGARGRDLKVGVGSFNVLGGRSASVRIRLADTARRAMHAHGRLVAAVAARDGAGNASRSRIALRPPGGRLKATGRRARGTGRTAARR
jgi:hypothetical protein